MYNISTTPTPPVYIIPPLSPLPYLCTSSTPSTFPRPPPNPTIRNATPNNPSQPAPISRPSQPPKEPKNPFLHTPPNKPHNIFCSHSERSRAWSSTQALPESYLPVFHIIPKPNAPPAFEFPSKTRVRQIPTFPLLEEKREKKWYR